MFSFFLLYAHVSLIVSVGDRKRLLFQDYIKLLTERKALLGALDRRPP